MTIVNKWDEVQRSGWKWEEVGRSGKKSTEPEQ